MDKCIFCKIASGQLPADVVYKDEKVTAFKDIHPKAPVHILIIPQKHITSLAEIKDADLPIISHMVATAGNIASQLGIGQAFKLVINTGEDAGQVIMHLHMHLLGGKKMPDQESLV